MPDSTAPNILSMPIREREAWSGIVERHYLQGAIENLNAVMLECDRAAQPVTQEAVGRRNSGSGRDRAVDRGWREGSSRRW